MFSPKLPFVVVIEKNNVQIEFFFSHLCPLLLLCIHIFMYPPWWHFLAHNKKVLGSNPPWLGPFGVGFACSLDPCVVLSMSTLGQIVVQHFV